MAVPWLDVLGWSGSAVLILSLSLANVLRFRALNLVASLMLVVFNAFLGIWPMVAMNGAIAVINVWHLSRLLRTRDDERTFEALLADPGSEYARHLLRVHGPDIARHNPGFDLDAVLGRPGRCWAFLVLRGDETVGIVLLHEVLQDERPSGDVRVELDYVTPRFRDLSVGTFVYRHDGRLAGLGMRRLVANDRMTDDYFRHVGFRPDGDRLVRQVRA
ncbi:hypothetical protein [Aquipuribacter nitratireducens]|uniref:N-acetyltransferase domain-containing protein n=1 Tax=Aquipuribacter nitratireducens TaxID=650104 RepID=A0ABW0GNN8_9MICO